VTVTAAVLFHDADFTSVLMFDKLLLLMGAASGIDGRFLLIANAFA
jgi:hypothetical protein